MLGTIFNLPPASQIIASSSEYTSPLVSDFLGVIYLFLGVIIAFAAITFLISVFNPHKPKE